VLNNLGPNVPSVALRLANDYIEIESNAALRAAIEKLSLPRKRFVTVPIADVDAFNVSSAARVASHATLTTTAMLIDPPNGSPTALLFHPYGGPNSQTVSARFSITLDDVIASQLGIVVATADVGAATARGTQRLSRCTHRLGLSAVADSIVSVRALLQQHLPKTITRTGVYGWSFGGYLSAKLAATLSARSIFDFSIAIAPVIFFLIFSFFYFLLKFCTR